MMDVYQVLEELSPTPVGRAFLVVHPQSPHSPRVLEAYDPSFALQSRFVRGLEQESASALAFEHPGSARVRDVQCTAPQPHLVRDYVPGVRLSHLLSDLTASKSVLPWTCVLNIGLQLASALQAAQAAALPQSRLHHGQLSPHEVLLDLQGHAVLLGLGSGRARHSLSAPTAGWAYAPPERHPSKALTGSADIYGLGLLLHEALWGRPAFVRSSAEATRQAVALEPLPGLASRHPGMADGLEDLLFSMCRKLPGERPDKMSTVIAAMKAMLPEPEAARAALLAAVRRYCAPRLARVARMQATLPSSTEATDDTHAFAADPTAWLPGMMVAGRYRIIEALGEGGAALVYRVEHVSLGREFALKALRPQLSSQASVVQRFRREAQAIGRLDHDNIVKVTDFGQTEEGVLFTVMDWVPGASLHDMLITVGALDAFTSLEVVKGVLEALSCAHDAKVVHRDIKPDNIMLATEDGELRVQLVDFGIAHLEDEGPLAATRITKNGMLLGTPAYMAPEQAAGEAVDHRVDLYSVGVVLYEALTGRAAYSGDSTVAVLSKVLTQAPAPPKFEVPEGLDAAQLRQVLQRALSKDPSARFQSAADFLEALQSCDQRA